MFIRVAKMFILMFLFFIPLGIALLLSLDYTGHGPNTGIPRLGLSNLNNNTKGRLYAHAVVMDIYTLIALYMMYRLYKAVCLRS
jgi:hypothetical protein